MITTAVSMVTRVDLDLILDMHAYDAKGFQDLSFSEVTAPHLDQVRRVWGVERGGADEAWCGEGRGRYSLIAYWLNHFLVHLYSHL